jgi:phosphatidylglycerophosphatase A
MDRVRPFLALLPDRLVVNLCTCGPVGFWGKAPGTNGTLVGIGLYTLLFPQLGVMAAVLLAGLLTLLAVALCDEGERRMQQRDPGSMILDEVVAVPLCFIGLQPMMASSGQPWLFLIAGFLLFRLFDISKPLGINRLQKLKGGLGVVADDIAAALATNLCLQLGAFAGAAAGWW